jgi:hypothetical protein
MNELEWLSEQRPEIQPDPAAQARVRRALRYHARPPVPKHRRAAPRRAGFVAVAALFAAAMAIAWPATSPDVTAPIGTPEVAEAAPLVLLAEKIAAEPEPKGDATLVQRSHHFPDGAKDFTGNDLYLDNGRYYFGATRAELKSATKQDGEYDLVVKAAAAADYDQMWKATFSGHPVLEQNRMQRDNRAWFGSMDALLAGAGRADVRAGVMQILATMPKVKATRTEDTLTITQTDFSDGYEETLIVDAQSGVPIQFIGGDHGKAPSVTVDYDIKRVTAANWADAAA